MEPNGGTGGSTTATVTKSATATSLIAAPTKAGYTLEGWFTAATGGVKVLSPDGSELYGAESYTAPTDPYTWDRTKPATLYAHWTYEPAPTTYTVTFKPDQDQGEDVGKVENASGTQVSEISVKSGTEISVNENEITIGENTYHAIAYDGWVFHSYNPSSGTITSKTDIKVNFAQLPPV